MRSVLAISSVLIVGASGLFGIGCADPCGGPCLEVPSGIKGASFGMAPAEVSEVLGSELTVEEHVVRPRVSWLSRKKVSQQLTLPGTAATIETSVGEAPALCRFEFSTRDRLVGVSCDVNSYRVGSDSTAVLRTLKKRHGTPDDKWSRSEADRNYDYTTFRWSSKSAVLLLIRVHKNLYTLSNRTREHQSLFEQTRDRVDLDERRARKELEKGGSSKLSDDLSSAPEQP